MHLVRSKVLDRVSLRALLITGFTLVIALTIAVGLSALWGQYRSIQAIDHLLAVENRVAELGLRSNVAMLKARRAEKDFLLFQNEFGFSEARSRYMTLLRSNVGDIRNYMAEIDGLIRDPDLIPQTRVIEQAVTRYENGFLTIVALYGELGHVNTGLEGRFREKVHEIEAILRKHHLPTLMIDMLTLRRHEKDLIVRGQRKYVEAFRQGVDQFKTDVSLTALSPALKKELLGMADEYLALFEQYLQISIRIDDSKADYLAAAHTVEPLLENLQSIANRKAIAIQTRTQEAARSTAAETIAVIGLAALLAFGVAQLVSGSISRSVTECLTFAWRVADGDLTPRLTVRAQNEFGALAGAMNRMTAALQTSRKSLEAHVAELAARERELARSHAELEQFAYIASHDLQEPLRTLMSYTQLLTRRYSGKGDKEADEFVSYITDAVRRMKGLNEGLLAFLSVSPQYLKPELADLNHLLDAALANLKVAIESSGANVTHDPLPALRVDSQQVTQLFQNLVDNALKFRRETPPEVHVSAEHTSGEWTFSMRDNGIGIDPQYSERVFVLFERLHTSDQYTGHGVGLTLCKKIVECHGGHIWVEQGNPGSVVRFTLRDSR